MEGVGVFFQREKDELSKYCSRLEEGNKIHMVSVTRNHFNTNGLLLVDGSGMRGNAGNADVQSSKVDRNRK